ncbi:TPA: hypothetical protein DCQ44_00830 [Candidatus Taylorbacteria bacterium]|nr:hypothetical protein [Candidatus Taylorbacteria bacterium]
MAASQETEFRTSNQLSCWNGAQCDEAFGLVNIFFYNINHTKEVIEPFDLFRLTDEQKERLLRWYITQGGAVGFERREAEVASQMPGVVAM